MNRSIAYCVQASWLVFIKGPASEFYVGYPGVIGETENQAALDLFRQGETFYQEAAALFELAHKQGHLGATRNLANVLYLLGRIDEARTLYLIAGCKDESEIIDIEIAAANGDADAQYRFGEYYACENYEEIGHEMPFHFNMPEASRWYLKAATQGHMLAQYKLGMILSRAKGVAKNNIEAAKWFLASAEQGCAEAQYEIGTSYHAGVGVQKDLIKAGQWLCKSAAQGHDEADFWVACMYHEGEGLPRDLIRAHAWFNISGARGYDEAKKRRGLIETQMSSGQIIEATEIAHELLAKMPVST